MPLLRFTLLLLLQQWLQQQQLLLLLQRDAGVPRRAPKKEVGEKMQRGTRPGFRPQGLGFRV